MKGLQKVNDKIKKALPYIIVNLTGAALSVLSCFFDRIAIAGLIFAFPFLRMPLFPLIVLITIFNIAACIIAGISADNYAGLIFAILYGHWGAFIGTLLNRNYKYAKAVRVIFNAHIWICVWGFCSIYYVGSHF